MLICYAYRGVLHIQTLDERMNEFANIFCAFKLNSISAVQLEA